MEKCFEACGYWEYCYRSSCATSDGAGVCDALIAVDRKSTGHTVGKRWWNNVVFFYLA
jgi:hypothetical protein